MAYSEIDTFYRASVACFSEVPRPSAEPALQPGRELVRMQEWPLRSHLELRARPASVRSARRHAKNMLHVWRMAALADTVELLVSEIMTNAVRASTHIAHQQGEAGRAPRALPMRLWLTSNRHSVLIQVWDNGHHHPVRQDVELDAEAGRGLLLVETLSTKWGCYAPDVRGGKIVWAVCAQRGNETVPGSR
jgi:anti-sigma regulatory factor (Ser/Thr protein kinase)